VLVAVIALGASTVLRSGGPPSEPAAATTPATAAAGATGGDVPRLRIDGDAALRDTGDAIDVRLPVVNEGRSTVTVTAVPSLPAGFTAVLPSDGLALDAGAAGELVLAWAGPDCAADVPQHVLPEVELDVRSADAAAKSELTVTVPSQSVDRTLQDAWRAACDENPEDVPEDGTPVPEVPGPGG